MTANIWKVGTSNAFSTSLNGGITDTDETITLTSVTGLQAPGVLTIDRIDANNVSTPITREYISFTDIAGMAVTGCVRGIGGSLAQSHSSGTHVEETWSITHWNDFLDMFAVAHDTTGKIVTSTATITTVISQDATFSNSINLSGASITGNLPITPVWVVSGAMSVATTSVGPSVSMPQNGTWKWFSATLKTPVSGASFILDFNKNGTSIFEAGTRPYIPGGSLFVSTASIATKTFVAGDIFTLDVDAGAGTGSNLTYMGRAY